MRLVFDFETNGLLDRKDLKILCGAAIDVDTGEVYKARPGDFDAFAALLKRATMLIGHNIVGFDIPLMERLLGFKLDPKVDLFDTSAVASMRYVATLAGLTHRYRNHAGRSEVAREARYPAALLKDRFGNCPNTLEAWGWRIGHNKKDFLKTHGVQEAFSAELLDYCVGDNETNLDLFHVLCEPDRLGDQMWRIPPKGATWSWNKPAPSMRSCTVESRYAYLKRKQEENGVGFDHTAAVKLVAHLSARREEITAELRRKWFPDWVTQGEEFTPKVNNKKLGYEKGCPMTKVVYHTFNPGSRAQIADRMKTLYGWKPREFTDNGAPKVDEASFGTMDHPAGTVMAEYLTIVKRLGQISEGEKSWLKNLHEDGKIHGVVKPSGTRTSRCAHSRPNCANVPAVETHPETGEVLTGLAGGYGYECRSLFRPTRPGWVQVGIDAQKLELACLAHRLAFYDNGTFANELLKGDPHSAWQAATGLFFRSNQKTLTYGDLYGAGDEKRGFIVLDDWRAAYKAGLTKTPPPPLRSATALGKKVAAQLSAKVPGLQKLKEACKEAFRRGFVVALDGRVIPTNSEHGTLNDVLQSDGAIIMKHAHIIAVDELFPAEGWVWGEDFACMLDVHDEWQFECRPEIAERLGELGCNAITVAGERLGVRCPLSGSAKIGQNWSETH